MLRDERRTIVDYTPEAFDLHYVLTCYPGGAPEIASALRALMDDPDAREAIDILERNYRTMDGLGPARAAYFLFGDPGEAGRDDVDALRATAHAYVRQLLALLRESA